MSKSTSDLKCEMCGKKIEGKSYYIFGKHLCFHCYLNYLRGYNLLSSIRYEGTWFGGTWSI
jgi:hypothetical protein